MALVEVIMEGKSIRKILKPEVFNRLFGGTDEASVTNRLELVKVFREEINSLTLVGDGGPGEIWCTSDTGVFVLFKAIPRLPGKEPVKYIVKHLIVSVSAYFQNHPSHFGDASAIAVVILPARMWKDPMSYLNFKMEAVCGSHVVPLEGYMYAF
mgnify:CR=1 FL=1